MGITRRQFEQIQERLGGASPRAVSPVFASALRAAPNTHCVILGVDPSLRGTGFGVIRLGQAVSETLAHGTISCPAGWEHSRCLVKISQTLREVSQKHRPTVCVVEGLFYAQNLQTALIMGEARGAALAAVAEAGLEIFEIAPRKVKQAVVGYGAAQKSAVAKMVQRLLNLPKPPAPDAADALALALAHAQEQPIQSDAVKEYEPRNEDKTNEHRTSNIEHRMTGKMVRSAVRCSVFDVQRSMFHPTMITFLHGKLVEALPTQVVVDVNGVGYEALIPLSSFDKLPQPGGTVKLLTQLVIREDAHTLYGFMSAAERDLFRLLVNTVSGIGPKTALNILSGISVTAFRGAVAGGDVKALSQISGVGKKTAERIVVELRDKIGAAGAWEAASARRALSPDDQKINDAVLALMALGFKQIDAHDAVRAAQTMLGAKATVEDLVRACLKKGA